MKIGMVHLYLGTESGDPRMFFSIAQGLQKSGHRVIIYTGQFDPRCFPSLNKGLDIVSVNTSYVGVEKKVRGVFDAVRSRLAMARFQRGAIKRIKRKLDRDLDVLICQNDDSYQLGVYYKRFGRDTRVLWIMNNPPFYHERKPGFFFNIGSIVAALFEKLKVACFISGIDLIVVHDAERKKLAEKLGAPTALLHIPVDYESFQAPIRVIEKGLKKQIVLLGVGSLSPTRKYEDIILAGAHLQEAGYHARVVLVCKDISGNISYRSRLEELVHSFLMDGMVEFYFEGVTESELRSIQQRSHIFVFPNHVNIWGMAAFEAMASGLALITSRVTSVAEVLTDEENALFVDPGDSRDIAQKARLLMDDPILYRRIASNGQKFVREKLNWETYIRDLLSLVTIQQR